MPIRAKIRVQIREYSSYLHPDFSRHGQGNTFSSFLKKDEFVKSADSWKLLTAEFCQQTPAAHGCF